VRELENLLHRAVALSSGDAIGEDDLGVPLEVPEEDGAATRTDARQAVLAAQPATASLAIAPLPKDLAGYLDTVERDILVRALEQHRFNRTAAGASLGLSLRQMRYRMARLGVMVAEHGVATDSDDS
jgi:two-component system response regulator PilR (NtrC family)